MISTVQAALWKKSLCASLLFLVFPSKSFADGASAIGAASEAIQQARFSEAKTIASEALKRYPNEIQLWNILGIAETELHAPLSARKAFARGLELDPKSVSLNENIGFLFYRQAEYSSAKTYLARAISLGSQQPGVRFSLAASRLRTAEPVKALAELKALEPELSSVPGYWEERGRAESAEDPAAAETSFKRALSLDPESAVALNGAASIAEMQGRDEQALSYLVRAKASHPDDIETLTHFGAVCIRRDLGPDARDALERARQLQPANDTVIYLLARANVSLQNWREAYDLFHQFSLRRPSFAPAYYAMGWLAMRLNNTEDARSRLEQCLKLEPALVDARVDLAQLELDDGNSEKAERLLHAALTAQPSHALGNVMMAGILLRRGDLDAAQACLEKALVSDPKSAPAHYRLATVFQRRRQPEAAQREQAIATDLNAQAKQTSKTQLRLLLPEHGLPENELPKETH